MTDPTTPPRPVTEARDALLARRISHTGYCVVQSKDGHPDAVSCVCGYARDLDNLIALARDDLAARVCGMDEDESDLDAGLVVCHGIRDDLAARVAALEGALRFLWRRARRDSDGPAMYLIEHVLYCGCGDDQHLMDRSEAQTALTEPTPARPLHGENGTCTLHPPAPTPEPVERP